MRSDPHALAFSTPAWSAAICAGGSYAGAARLYEMPDGGRLILPFLRTRHGPARAATQASLPLGWGPGGLIGDRPIGPEDVAAVWADLARTDALITSIRPSPLLGPVWAQGTPASVLTVPRIAHVLDLQGGFSEVWSNRFSTATRTKLRKAEKTGLSVERDTTGRLVPVFAALYDRWLESRALDRRMPRRLALALGRRREPTRKLELAASTFGEDCRIWVAWSGAEAVAAAIVLVHGDHAVYWRGTSDRLLSARTRANDLLQRLAIEDACDSGCRYYHMGESGGVESLMHFKERFGARPFQYAEHRLERVPVSSLKARANELGKRVERRLMAGGR